MNLKFARNRAQRLRLSISVVALSATLGLMTIGFAPSATALTIIDFNMINPSTTPSIGSNSKTIAPGEDSPYFGTETGNLSIAFQGDGSSIENGSVSISEGLLSNYSVTEVGTLIKVTVDIDSTYGAGDNDDIGMLTGWDGTSGVIIFNSKVAVINNGYLACEGPICDAVGTVPNDGEVFEFTDDPVEHEGVWANMIVNYDAGNLDNPYHFQLAESLTGTDPANGNEVNFMSLEGEGAVVPEPNTALLVALGLVGLAANERNR
jgi:hypothetical protein